MKIEEELLVVLFNQTAHGMRYWRTCSAGDIVTYPDTVAISDPFSVNEGQTVEEAYSEAFSRDISEKTNWEPESLTPEGEEEV